MLPFGSVVGVWLTSPFCGWGVFCRLLCCWILSRIDRIWLHSHFLSVYIAIAYWLLPVSIMLVPKIIETCAVGFWRSSHDTGHGVVAFIDELPR